MTITDIVKLESWHWRLVIDNQRVTLTAFAILAMFVKCNWQWSIKNVQTWQIFAFSSDVFCLCQLWGGKEELKQIQIATLTNLCNNSEISMYQFWAPWVNNKWEKNVLFPGNHYNMYCLCLDLQPGYALSVFEFSTINLFRKFSESSNRFRLYQKRKSSPLSWIWRYEIFWIESTIK